MTTLHNEVVAIREVMHHFAVALNSRGIDEIMKKYVQYEVFVLSLKKEEQNILLRNSPLFLPHQHSVMPILTF